MRLQRVRHDWATFTSLISRQPSCRLTFSCDLPTNCYCFFLKKQEVSGQKVTPSQHCPASIRQVGEAGTQIHPGRPLLGTCPAASRDSGMFSEAGPWPLSQPQPGAGGLGAPGATGPSKTQGPGEAASGPICRASPRNSASGLREPLWAWLQGGHHAAPWRFPGWHDWDF